MQDIDIQKIIQISKLAGDEILKIYNDESQFNIVDYKADDSPLTIADKKSHDVIAQNLEDLYSQTPLLSEEGKDIPYGIRKYWSEFWLVDPLDGTKEFIKRNGEFTVNIALIEEGYPVLGVIYAPVLDTFYYAMKNEGAYKMKGNHNTRLKISARKTENLTAVRSRSHASPEEDEIYKKYQVTEFTSVGSSLKFCMVAEGKADLYYRYGPTMEWDTGAGQTIIENAGYQMINMKTSERFSYNKESLLNPGFLVN
jgi:3'(2'), 5'-bisphosphate nucleotidase